ncbi:hypothetical protein Bbelb_131760 [Branchiostoma belcheri]|nr:hypothetical protein Bbelb_131760 [Branchiostoma belcheri]
MAGKTGTAARDSPCRSVAGVGWGVTCPHVNNSTSHCAPVPRTKVGPIQRDVPRKHRPPPASPIDLSGAIDDARRPRQRETFQPENTQRLAEIPPLLLPQRSPSRPSGKSAERGLSRSILKETNDNAPAEGRERPTTSQNVSGKSKLDPSQKTLSNFHEKRYFRRLRVPQTAPLEDTDISPGHLPTSHTCPSAREHYSYNSHNNKSHPTLAPPTALFFTRQIKHATVWGVTAITVGECQLSLPLNFDSVRDTRRSLLQAPRLFLRHVSALLRTTG